MSTDTTSEKTLHEAMEEAGVVVGTHESDLYVLDTQQSREILQTFGKNPETLEGFVSQTGEGRCLDVPFENQDFWRRKQEREQARQKFESSGPGM